MWQVRGELGIDAGRALCLVLRRVLAQSCLADGEDTIFSYTTERLFRLFPRRRSHIVRRQVAGPGDTVLDCTAGNGYDSLELAKTIALKDGLGSLYIMDVQVNA